MNKQQVLYISPFPFDPPSTGGERAIKTYINDLAIKNHVIVCAPRQQNQVKHKNIHIVSFYNSGKSKYINLLAYFKILQLAKKEKPKKIIFAFPYQGYYSVVISRLTRTELIYHEHNIEFLRFKSMNKWWWPMMYIYEAVLYKLVDKVEFISENDKELAKKHFNTNNMKIIYKPYVADPSIFKPDKKAGNEIRRQLKLINNPIVLFFGTLNYKPNIEAIQIITDKIAPIVYKHNKNVRFLIVGKNPPSNIQAKNIIFTGFVEKIEDYINAADLVIVPLISGGGVRTKIIESLACKKRVLSTSLGAEGLNGKNKNLFIIDRWNEFNFKLLDLI